jgi:hypothetical protein
MKRIKKTDLKYAEQTIDLNWLVKDINNGGERQESALFILNPCCTVAGKESTHTMTQLIYSLAKQLKSNDARFVIREVANKLGSCQAYVERWMRGMDNVEINTQFGQNYINVI